MKAGVPFWSSLRVRVMIGVVVPLTIALALAAQIQIARHRELLLDNLEALSLSVGDGVETALTQAMLNRDSENLSQIVHELASRGSIRRVMIVDNQGIVRIASHATDLGAIIPLSGESGYSFILADTNGSRVFRNVTPILNRVACQSCHGAASRLNGRLVIDLPYETVAAALDADWRQSLVLAAATIILVSLAINLLLSRIVVAKLERFRTSLARFAQGDFSLRVPADGGDEVAELAATVNAMADGLGEKAKLEQEVEDKAHALELESARLSALYRVALESSRSLNLDQVMRAGLESALAVTGMEAGEIRLDAGSGGRLRIQSAIGAPQGFICEEERIAIGECLCGQVVSRGEIYAAAEIHGDPQATRLACRRYGFCGLAAVPLKARGHAVGVLSLHSHGPRAFSPGDLAMLGALGDQLGVAIDNARLYTEMEARVRELSQRVQHLAVTEERVRLAREMHDGFAQALSVLNLKLRLLQNADGDRAVLNAGLDEMRQVVSETYEDVRQAISDLRTPMDHDGKVVGMLVDYVQNFALRYDLQARVIVTPEAEAVCCTPDASPQILRIVQEALTNVRKHARAQQIEIEFAREADRLKLRLSDDGQGFDPASVARREGHFGLAIMQERAASFGGELRIESRPGRGTTLTLRVPTIPEEK